MKDKKPIPLESLNRLYDFNDLPNRNIVIYLVDQENLPTYYNIAKTALIDYEELQKVLDDFGIHNTMNLIDTLKNIRSLEKQNAINSKKLKALEIIKKKRVDVNDLLLFVDLKSYNEYVCACDDNDKRTLTKEEYKLLKEVLK